MAVKKTKTNFAGATLPDRFGLRRDHGLEAGEVADSKEDIDRWSQHRRSDYIAPSWWRPQAAVPDHRLQTRQGRDSRPGRLYPVRPQSQRSYCAPQLRRRREALHPGSTRGQRGRDARVGLRRRDQAGQRTSSAQRPGRNDGPRHRDAARWRGQVGSFGGNFGSVDVQRGRPRSAPSAFR